MQNMKAKLKELKRRRENGDLKYGGDCMSNFDHRIEEGVEDRLRKGDIVCDYAAMNFFGNVWYEDGKFKCLVNQYCEQVEIVEQDTLEEIMEYCSDKYGNE